MFYFHSLKTDSGGNLWVRRGIGKQTLASIRLAGPNPSGSWSDNSITIRTPTTDIRIW